MARDDAPCVALAPAQVEPQGGNIYQTRSHDTHSNLGGCISARYSSSVKRGDGPVCQLLLVFAPTATSQSSQRKGDRRRQWQQPCCVCSCIPDGWIERTPSRRYRMQAPRAAMPGSDSGGTPSIQSYTKILGQAASPLWIYDFSKRSNVWGNRWDLLRHRHIGGMHLASSAIERMPLMLACVQRCAGVLPDGRRAILQLPARSRLERRAGHCMEGGGGEASAARGGQSQAFAPTPCSGAVGQAICSPLQVQGTSYGILVTRDQPAPGIRPWAWSADGIQAQYQPLQLTINGEARQLMLVQVRPHARVPPAPR